MAMTMEAPTPAPTPTPTPVADTGLTILSDPHDAVIEYVSQVVPMVIVGTDLS